MGIRSKCAVSRCDNTPRPSGFNDCSRLVWQCLAAGERNDGIPSFDTQRAVLKHYRRELQRLSKGEIPLRELVITRRTSRSLGDYRQERDVRCPHASQRTRYEIPAGGKVRYVVMDRESDAFWTAPFLQKNWKRSRLAFMHG